MNPVGLRMKLEANVNEKLYFTYLFSLLRTKVCLKRENLLKWELSPGNKVDSSFYFTENWLFLGGQGIGLAQRQCSINVC